MINDTPRWLLALGTVCVILGTVLVILSLAGCAPPPPAAGTTVLDGATLQDATTPPWLWRGADHPEWASCRYEPPSALCTEAPKP